MPLFVRTQTTAKGLVQKMEDWEFSFFQDYAGLRKGTLCNQILANQFIDFDKDNFIQQSYNVIDKSLFRKNLCKNLPEYFL
ncbi:MAG: hypothetical protein EAZ97_01820 [Bacteroidetes bacterium]|nr:MAG: hypothetical protein EAZ97_01820 [Bacteroidota bacterium]